MPSPCLLCRHHHRRRRHRYTPSSPTPSSRCTVPSQVVLSSPVTAIVVVVVVVPVVPRHYRRQGANPLTASRGRSSPVRETSCSSASDASVVATSASSSTGNLTIPQEEESRSLFAHQVGHSGYRYRIKNRRKEGSTEARGGGDGGGGDERGDSPSRCTRCPTDTAIPQAKGETTGSSGSRSSSSSPSAPGECCNSSSLDLAVVPVLVPAPALALALVPVSAPAPVFALAYARALERADCRRRRRRRRGSDYGGTTPGPTWIACPPCTVWARCAPSTPVPRRRCHPICC